jgi:hypothetical protein
MGGFSPAVVRAYLDAQVERIRALGHEAAPADSAEAVQRWV